MFYTDVSDCVQGPAESRASVETENRSWCLCSCVLVVCYSCSEVESCLFGLSLVVRGCLDPSSADWELGNHCCNYRNLLCHGPVHFSFVCLRDFWFWGPSARFTFLTTSPAVVTLPTPFHFYSFQSRIERPRVLIMFDEPFYTNSNNVGQAFKKQVKCHSFRCLF